MDVGPFETTCCATAFLENPHRASRVFVARTTLLRHGHLEHSLRVRGRNAVSKTRRNFSIRGLTYQRLKDHCLAEGKSVSGMVEEILARKLDEADVPIPDHVDPPNTYKPRKRGIWTF